MLKNGDIVNIDVSTVYNGFFSDSSRMYVVGDTTDIKKKLVEVAKECMLKGIEKIKPWKCIGNVGFAINKEAKRNGFSVVKEIGGHGIGIEFHEEPWVGYVSQEDTGVVMVPGMIFTVEPMINMGSSRVYTSGSDGWTVYTKDKLPSAQWECMVLVTNEGHEVLAY